MLGIVNEGQYLSLAVSLDQFYLGFASEYRVVKTQHSIVSRFVCVSLASVHSAFLMVEELTHLIRLKSA